MLSIMKVSKEEFDESGLSLYLDCGSRVFCFVTDENFGFKASFQRDLVEPILFRVKNCVNLFAVDFKLLIINFCSREVVLEVCFSSFILDVFVHTNFIVAISENRVDLIDKNSLTVFLSENLPDLYFDHKIQNNELHVLCYEEKRTIINLLI